MSGLNRINFVSEADVIGNRKFYSVYKVGSFLKNNLYINADFRFRDCQTVTDNPCQTVLIFR